MDLSAQPVPLFSDEFLNNVDYTGKELHYLTLPDTQSRVHIVTGSSSPLGDISPPTKTGQMGDRSDLFIYELCAD